MLNIYMKDAYTTAFYDVVKETQATSGLELPHHVEAYIVMLLSDFVDRNDIPPDSTFAEMFLTLRDSRQAKQLGDTCLFVAGAFPRLKAKHGINRRYYQDIGSTSYEMASNMNAELFPLLARHFVFLSEFIELTVNSSIQKHSNLFR
jgi:hypothetical protein